MEPKKFDADFTHRGRDMDDLRFRIQPYQQIASACTGALITSLFMTPLDVVKTRLQAQQRSLLSNKCFLYCNGLMDHLCPCGPNSFSIGAKTTTHFNGTIDAFVKISRTEGVNSLWSGLGPTLVLAVPATVIYFVTYEQLRLTFKDFYLKKVLKDSQKEPATVPFYIPLLAGCSARIVSVSIVNPLELIRTKMQSQKLSYFELRQALRSMINNEGVRGLWRGLTPTLYRDVPFSGIYWTCYENIKSYYNVITPTFGFSFAAGAISGSIAALVTTPFDVIKTHAQIEFGEKVIYAEQPPKNVATDTTLTTMKKIYRNNGIRGLFAGIAPRLAKVAPACAIMIASFEYGKSFFYNHNVNRFIEMQELKSKLGYTDPVN